MDAVSHDQILEVNPELLGVRRMLVAVAFSPAEKPAVRSAVSLGGFWGAELTFLHVLEPVSDHPEIVGGEAFPGQRREVALRELKKLANELGVAGAECVVGAGRAYEEILRRLDGGAFGLVVVGQAKEKPGFLKGLLGSTVERVARHSPVPMLMVREDHEAMTEQPKKLALATDFSGASLAAFPWVEVISRRFGASIELVNVQPPMGLPGTVEYERHQEQIDELRKKAEDELWEFREEHLEVDL